MDVCPFMAFFVVGRHELLVSPRSPKAKIPKQEVVEVGERVPHYKAENNGLTNDKKRSCYKNER